jgi:hypothetical protein
MISNQNVESYVKARTVTSINSTTSPLADIIFPSVYICNVNLVSIALKFPGGGVAKYFAKISGGHSGQCFLDKISTGHTILCFNCYCIFVKSFFKSLPGEVLSYPPHAP